MLELSGIDAGYGDVQVLYGVDLALKPGKIHCLMGRNGAGKTTTLRTIMGLVRPMAGHISMNGTRIDEEPAHRIVSHGIGYVPQGRRLFSDLTVDENLDVGLMARPGNAAMRNTVLDMFPRLRERLGQRAETLSGGEQQMLATARALCINPSALLLDEPTEGLQPSMIAIIRDAMTTLRDRGVGVLLVEQRVDAVLAISDTVTFLENGRVAESRKASSLSPTDPVFREYVGV